MLTEARSHNPFKEAHKLRQAGQLGASFEGTYEANTRMLPEGGEHALEPESTHSHHSKATKAAEFLNSQMVEKGKN